MSAARRPSPAKKNAPADVAASRGPTEGGPTVGGNVAANDDADNILRAVASGSWTMNGRSLEVDVVKNKRTGEKMRMVRISNLFEGFESSPKSGHSSRSLDRLLSDFGELKVRPRRYGLRHGFAHGFTSDEVKALITAVVDRALAGKLHEKQRKLLAFFRAIEKALIGEALDAIIDRACGIAVSDAEQWRRLNERLVSEQRRAAQELTEETARAASYERELACEKRVVEGLTKTLEKTADHLRAANQRAEKLEVRVAELEQLAQRDGTVGAKWAHECVLLVLQHIASVASAANGKSKASNRRKVENLVRAEVNFVKRGSRWENYPATPQLVSALKTVLDAELSKWTEARREAAKNKPSTQLVFAIVFLGEVPK